MRISGYLKTITLILLLAAPVQAEAVKWSSRCILYSGSRVSCEEISAAANRLMTSAFISKYPSDKYLILYTASAAQYSDGVFTYGVFASLHEIRDDMGRWIKFPLIAGHRDVGYASNPSFARQQQLLLRAAEKATAALVSEVTGR